MQTVHVISFSPANKNAATGGFDWTFDEQHAKDWLIKLMTEHPRTEDYNFSLVHLQVPELPDNSMITDWIGARLGLIEPRGN